MKKLLLLLVFCMSAAWGQGYTADAYNVVNNGSTKYFTTDGHVVSVRAPATSPSYTFRFPDITTPPVAGNCITVLSYTAPTVQAGFGSCGGSASFPIYKDVTIGGGGASRICIVDEGVGLLEVTANYSACGGLVDSSKPGLFYRIDPRLSGEMLHSIYMKYPAAINSGSLVQLVGLASNEINTFEFQYGMYNGTYLAIGGAGFGAANQTVIKRLSATFAGPVKIVGDLNTVASPIPNGYFTNLFCAGTQCPGLPSTNKVTVTSNQYPFGCVTESTSLFECGFNDNRFGTQYLAGAGGFIRWSDNVADKPISFWVRTAGASSSNRISYFDNNGTYVFSSDIKPSSSENYNLGDNTHIIANAFFRNVDASFSALPMPGNGYVKAKEFLLADYNGLQPGNWHMFAFADNGGLGSNQMFIRDGVNNEIMRFDRVVTGTSKNQIVLTADMVGTGPNYEMGATTTPSFKFLPFRHYWSGGLNTTGGFFGGNTSGSDFNSPAGTVNSTIAQFGGVGYVPGTGWLQVPKAGMTVQASETWSGTAQGAYLAFFTTQAGTTNVVTRVSITGGGGDNSSILTLGDFLGGHNGGLKLSNTTNKLQWTHDITSGTWTDFGSTSGSSNLPYVYAKNLGAYCDGSSHTVAATSDFPLTHAKYTINAGTDQVDWAAIQEAILTAKSSTFSAGKGAEVRINPGECQINREINVGDGSSSFESTYQAVSLIGSGDGTTRLATSGVNSGATILKWTGGSSSSSALIRINGPISGVRIENMFLNGQDNIGYGIYAMHASKPRYAKLLIHRVTTGIKFDAYGSVPSGTEGIGANFIDARDITVKSLNACSGIGLDVGTTAYPGGSGLDVASGLFENIVVTGDPTTCAGTESRIGIRLNYTDSMTFRNIYTGPAIAHSVVLKVVSGATSFPKQITFHDTWLNHAPELDTTAGTWAPPQHGLVMKSFGDDGSVTCPSFGSTYSGYVRCERGDGSIKGNWNYQDGLSINGNIIMDSAGDLAALGGAWNAVQSSGGFRTTYRYWSGFSGSYDPAGTPFSTLGQLALNTTDAAIQLQKEGGFAGGVADSYGSTSVSVWKGRHANGSIAFPSPITAGQYALAIGGHGCYQSTTNCFDTSANVQIGLQAAKDYSPTERGSQIVFQNTIIGTASRVNTAALYTDSGQNPTLFLGNVSPNTVISSPGTYSAGGIRWNNATSRMQFTNDLNTWTDFGSGGGISNVVGSSPISVSVSAGVATVSCPSCGSGGGVSLTADHTASTDGGWTGFNQFQKQIFLGRYNFPSQSDIGSIGVYNSLNQMVTLLGGSLPGRQSLQINGDFYPSGASNNSGYNSGLASSYWDTTYTANVCYGGSHPCDRAGSGAPSISCSVGDTYRRTNGGFGSTFYVCEATNTWTAK